MIGGEDEERAGGVAHLVASTEPPIVIGGESSTAPATAPARELASTEPPIVIGGEMVTFANGVVTITRLQRSRRS